ncbi:MAG: helix-turn-helix domain-containing protein [Flavobacterium sp.]|uniref:winged helix-turn-helix transcriptional regulator n=1 Tax=Flavobacterium sp. TaxID=239 RepID=UPI003263193B
MKKNINRSECPISCTLDIFGDKWSLLIIRDMLFFNKNTYGDFLKSEEKIATNILASRLQTLEENGILKKLEHPDSKAKVLYTMTPKGIDLLPILLEIHFWANKYFLISPEIQARIKEAKKDKEGFIKSMTKELKERFASEQSKS